MFDNLANAESCQEYMSVCLVLAELLNGEEGEKEGAWEQGYHKTLHIETHDPPSQLCVALNPIYYL